MPLPNLETWMWTEACETVDRAERLHRQFFRPAVMNAKRPMWEPPIDIFETSCEFNVMIALPGVAPEHLDVLLEDGFLVIDGHRRLPTSTESYIRRLEIPYGQFKRRVELPVGRFEIHTRVFENGCLLITLRKT
ncbi:MAG: Hsp20/alpha crystallin family protein [Methylococcaceae bacterium]|nr:Hsp20/alpha crystallin family protein [Methylococcaceae bacterium]